MLTLDDEGNLTPLHKVQGPTNPAYFTFQESKNVVYACTESILEPGELYSYSLSNAGEMKELSRVDAVGYSTCYITLDKDEKFLLVANYW